MGITKNNSTRELARFQKTRECVFFPVGQDVWMKSQHAAHPSPCCAELSPAAFWMAAAALCPGSATVG